MTKNKQTGSLVKTFDMATASAVSSELTRDMNRDLVLERIRALQPISRVDLARATGLQPSTVSLIVEQLLGESWIREGATVKTARGRRPTMLMLNDDLVILVADVRPERAVVGVVDLNGRLLSRVVVPLARDVTQSVSGIAAAMEELRREQSGKTFEGIGISMPGRVDSDTKRLAFAPNLKWHDSGIGKLLSEKLALRTEMENAANACLLSEAWLGRLDNVRHAVLVTISEGVGTAVLTGGRLITGHKGLAGEFGHIVVDANGPECGCGQKGCWEMFASSRAALRYYAEQVPGAEKLSVSDLLALALDGNVAALEAIHRQAVAIGRGLRMLKAAFSPEVILFVGDITTLWRVSEKTIRSECAGGLVTGFEPKIVSLGDGEMARLRGAAAVVLQRHSGYYLASYLRGRGRSRKDPAQSGKVELSW